MLPPISQKDWTREKAAHLLCRAGFGGTPAEVEELHKLGPEGAVDHLIHYDRIAEDYPKPDWAEPDLEFMDKRRKSRGASEEERRKMRAEQKREEFNQTDDLRHWWLHRMRTTPRPLQEKLTLFWHGHFATSIEKVNMAYLMWLQNDTLRRCAIGNWEQMLVAVSQDPAMLRYLDNAQSKREHPNENYARELMELFTLGEGHYTEEDVLEAARAFTGWTIDPRDQSFLDAPRMRDSNSKRFMGKSGKLDGKDIIEIILEQPQAARFIAGKLWRFFAYDNPSEALVNELAESLRKAKYEFQPFLRELFLSAEFYSRRAWRTQIKSPVQWLVAAVKSLESDLPQPDLATATLRTLGQSLFEPPNVKGWDGGIAWISTNSLLNRYNAARALGVGGGAATGRGPRAQMVVNDGAPPSPAEREKMADMKPRDRIRAMSLKRREAPSPVDAMKLVAGIDLDDSEKLVDALGGRLYFGPVPDKDRPSFIAYLEDHKTGTPGEETIRALIHLMMSSPRYQLT